MRKLKWNPNIKQIVARKVGTSHGDKPVKLTKTTRQPAKQKTEE